MASPDRAHGRRFYPLMVAACVPVLAFLVLPTLVIVPMALTAGDLIVFPPQGISGHAFADYLGDQQWMQSTKLSFEVAVLAVAIAALAGTSAAVALHGKRFPGRGAVTGLILAPIVVPLVVLGLGDYLLFAALGVLGGWAGIGVAHGVLVTPYVYISVATSLAAGLNPALVRSARSLGARPTSVFRHVYWPALRPGLCAGAVLAFAVSFDEVVLAWFLQGPQSTTLPVRMFTAVQFELTPKIMASASLFIGLATLTLLAQALIARPRRDLV
ncbi:MAG TPA: ABC transporter permease [Candidatus Sulfotelmatobacter sp.]|nr:ABC transporter permease [Candidatus Sulfotelmatobacter sp.]